MGGILGGKRRAVLKGGEAYTAARGHLENYRDDLDVAGDVGHQVVPPAVDDHSRSWQSALYWA